MTLLELISSPPPCCYCTKPIVTAGDWGGQLADDGKSFTEAWHGACVPAEAPAETEAHHDYTLYGSFGEPHWRD